MPVVLYGCETWSLTLTVEHTLRVSEKRVLRKIFGHKRDEVTGEYIRLHNKEIYDLYSSQNVNRVMMSRGMRWTGHVVNMADRRRAYRVGWGGLRKRVHFEDLSVDGRKILKQILKKWDAGMDWIVGAKDRDRWPALVRVVIYCGFRKMRGISLLDENCTGRAVA